VQKGGQIPLARHGDPAFEHRHRLAVLSPVDLQMPQNPAREAETVGMIERLGEQDAFLRLRETLLELSPLVEQDGQVAAGHHRRKSGKTEALPVRIVFEQPQNLAEKMLGPSIVSREETGRAEVEIPGHLKPKIPERLSNRLRVVAKCERLPGMAGHPEVVTHVDGCLPEAALIVESPCQTFRFAETSPDPLVLTKRMECVSKIKAKIDGLLLHFARLGQMPEGDERLFNARHRFR